MADRKWTKAQQTAIDAESGTLLVAAAAGSGKTSVLVERIVRKLTSPENPVPPESILVVTFTRAAAAEMKSRIFRRIGEKIAEEPARRAEFTLLMSKLGEMRVSTMDSFSISVVKENCHTLGIDSDFRMLDDGESKCLKNETAAEICEKRFTEHEADFGAIAELFDAGRDDSRLIKSITELSDFSMSEPFPEEWLDSIPGKYDAENPGDSIWGKIITGNIISSLEFASELLSYAMKDVSVEEELDAKLGDILRADADALDSALEEIPSAPWDSIRDIISSVLSVMKTQFRAPRGYTDNPSKLSAAEKRSKAKDVLKAAISLINCTADENAEDMKILKASAYEFTDTVKEFNALLLSKKKEQSLYDYNDILHFALSLLSDSSAPDGKTPLARELSENFSEILIDEYQDTNRAQDMLFRTLSKDGKNMFMVGDIKQSIYRFRLASPEIFIEKCEKFPYYDGNAQESKIILGQNFRSRKGITDCVNYVFSSLMSKECGEIEYGEDERLNFGADYYPEKPENDVVFSVIETNGENPYDTEAKYIASEIRKKLDEGFLISSKTGLRKITPGDFCILFRSPSGTAKHYIRELRSAGIPVSAENLESFFETGEIRTMMSYLRAIDNPGRDVDLLAVMLSPVFGFTPDDAAEIRIRAKKASSLYGRVVYCAENGNEKCRKLRDTIEYFKKLSSTCSIDVLISEIYSSSSYPVIAGAMEEGEMRKNNLRILLEYAKRKNSEASSDLGGFIRYMDMLRDNGAKVETGASSGGGVKIMSVHSSKGLEFPVVFLAGLSKRFNTSDLRSGFTVSHSYGIGMKIKEPENLKYYETLCSSAVKTRLSEQTLSEEMRIFYVALTRAAEKLYIVTAFENTEKKISDYEYLLPETEKIHPYLVKNISSPLSWFLMTIIRHPDSSVLRSISLSAVKNAGRADVEYYPEGLSYESCSKENIPVEYDSEILSEIREKTAFRYKYRDISYALSKHTASSLRSEHFDAASFGKSVPAFMFSSSLSPADIGTATHRFLEFCDFSECRKNASAEKDRLLSEGRLTEKQAGAVDMDAISDFMNSPVMERIDKASEVFREKQFTISKSICETDSSIPPEYKDEKTVVIGKIDLLFTENGKAVIVDYKTDNIKDAEILRSRYSEQMQLYAEAVRKSMDTEVKECILYSLKLKKYISLSI